MASPVFFIDIAGDGSVAVHPQRLNLPALVAPIPEESIADSVNTIREPLVAIGCMHLPARNFEFDSSFIGPQAENRFTKFATLMGLLREQDVAATKEFAPITVFGHADPVGTPEYNATLSGRRALSLYGLLTRDTGIWDTLFKGHQGDKWGRGAVRRMLSTPLRESPGVAPEPPFFTGPVEPATPADKPAVEKDTDAAIKAYKRARVAELDTTEPVSATLDGKTRKLLFREYMDAICHFDDLRPFVLDPVKHFIARKKDGKVLKGDVQGCGEFNPILLLSKAENELFAGSKPLQAARNQVNAPNRRVIAYIFRHGTEIDPKKWPCPRVSNGSTVPALNPCRDRFWSDFKQRLALGEDRRRFGKEMELAVPDDDGNFEVDGRGRVVFRDVVETGNTMACRFYHGFAAYSPCEAGLKEWVVRFRVDAVATANAQAGFVPLANKRFVLEMGESRNAAVVRGNLDAKGEIRIPVLDRHVLMTLKLDVFGSMRPSPPAGQPAEDPDKLVDGRFPGEDTFMHVVLDAGALKKMRSEQDVDNLASRQRLYNLGFGPPNPPKWDRQRDQVPAARAYRRSRQLPDDADLRDALVEEHDRRDADPVEPDEDAPPQ